MTAAIWKNYLTTFFGLLSGLPVIVLGVFAPGTPMALSPQWTHILMVGGGIGLVGLGLVAKAFNVHSTVDQIEQATVAKAQDSATVTTQATQQLPGGGIKVTTEAVTSTKPAEVPKT